jgi:hypothetical protein
LRTLPAEVASPGSSTKVRPDAPNVILSLTRSQLLFIKSCVSDVDAVCTGNGRDAESVREYEETMDATYVGMDALYVARAVAADVLAMVDVEGILLAVVTVGVSATDSV